MFLDSLVDYRYESNYDCSILPVDVPYSYLYLTCCMLHSVTDVGCSSSDDLCHRALISTIESVPMKGFVCRIVFRILQSCLRLSQKTGDSVSPESGNIHSMDSHN